MQSSVGHTGTLSTAMWDHLFEIVAAVMVVWIGFILIMASSRLVSYCGLPHESRAVPSTHRCFSCAASHSKKDLLRFARSIRLFRGVAYAAAGVAGVACASRCKQSRPIPTRHHLTPAPRIMNSEAWVSAFRKDGGAQSQVVIIVTCLVFGSMPVIELIKVHTAHTYAYAYAYAYALCRHSLPTPSRLATMFRAACPPLI